MKRSILFSAVVAAGAISVSAADNETNKTYQLPPVEVKAAAPEQPQAQGTAITTVSGDQVRVGEIQTLRDLKAEAPNLSVFDANNDRMPRFSVRGIRENNFFTGEPAVALYIDDVPYMDLASRNLVLHDIDHIDVLRGQQFGYGASGPAGVINIVSLQPENEWHGHADFSYGNYNFQDYRAALNAPLISSNLVLNVSGLFSEREGFVHNNFLNTDPDSKNTLNGRAQLRWTPSEQWTVSFTATGERNNDGFVPTFVPGPDQDLFSVNRNFDGFVNTRSDSQALKIAYDNTVVKITSITAHRDWRQNLLQDFDFSPFSIANGFSQPNFEQWSEELRIQSPDDADKLKWIGGLFYLDSSLRGNSGQISFLPIPLAPPPAPPLPPPSTIRTVSTSDSQTYTAFGEGTYSVCEKVDLTAGVRLTYDDRRMERARTLENRFSGAIPLAAGTGADHSSAALPKFSLAYHFTPKVQAYATVAAGYQAGGFNTSNDNPAQGEFSPSRSWQYEVGAKSKWLDDKLTANVSLFYTRTRNYQVYQISPVDPTQAFLLNAHRASSYGAELELGAQPIDRLQLSAVLGYTHAAYDSFFNPVVGKSYDGNTISFVPEFTADFSATYKLPCNFYVRGEVQCIGSFNLDDANTTKQNAITLCNAQVGYDSSHFDAYFFVRNMFDEHYVNNALDFGNGFLVRQPADPMTLGFAMSAKF